MESRINQEKDARRIVEQIAQGNYIAYSREKVQSERVSERLDQLVELLRPVLEERGRERIQMDYAAVFVQRDALERKAKKFEGECERLEGECERLEGEYEQLAQENAKLKQVLSQGGNEGGISAESTKRKRT